MLLLIVTPGREGRDKNVRQVVRSRPLDTCMYIARRTASSNGDADVGVDK